MKLFPAKCHERATLRKLWRQTGNSSLLPAKCWPLLHVIAGILARFSNLAFVLFCYTAISNNVVGSKHKAKRQDRKVMWDFFSEKKVIKTSYASPVQWRFTMASHLDERNFRISSRWGSSCFEDGKSGGSSSLSWAPLSCTRKHQWAVFSSCVTD